MTMKDPVVCICLLALFLPSMVEGFGFVDTVKSFFGYGEFDPVKVDKKTSFVKHLNNVTVVDYMQDHPKVRQGHRVADLFNGWHFDDILIDAPDEIRPPTVVAFFDSNDAECMKAYRALNFDTIAETKLPSRARLWTARYDMFSAPRRPWYEFTPEMDLKKRFNIQKCPEVVFASRKCDGRTVWCEKGPDPENPELGLLGCEDFTESCPSEYRESWDGKQDLVEWINKKVDADGEPKISSFLGSYAEQGRWLQKREFTTCNTYFRNIYMAQAFPAFTHRGFKAMETPKEFQEWLLETHKKHEHARRTEHWDATSTQMSFHEHPTTFIDLDRVRAEKEMMARKYLQPIVEEWSGMKPLELTSFYGIREYHEGAFLREHVDRIDTHVLSVTITVDKRDVPDGAPAWPLQVTDWTGQQVKYDHPAGTMILYESSKLPHGRPTPNKGGTHLGAFVHFKPKHMHGTDAQKWDNIASEARNNVRKHQIFASYKSTPAIEPKNPVYATQSYGEGSVYQKAGENGGAEDDGRFSVEFKNAADRTLQLFWYHKTQPEPVFQGKAWPGAGFSINTFQGHTFFWAELDSTEPLPGGKITIDAGKRVYKYSLKKDGSVQKASKWVKYAREAIEKEDAGFYRTDS